MLQALRGLWPKSLLQVQSVLQIDLPFFKKQTLLIGLFVFFCFNRTLFFVKLRGIFTLVIQPWRALDSLSLSPSLPFLSVSGFIFLPPSLSVCLYLSPTFSLSLFLSVCLSLNDTNSLDQGTLSLSHSMSLCQTGHPLCFSFIVSHVSVFWDYNLWTRLMGHAEIRSSLKAQFTIVWYWVANICSKSAYINSVNYPPELDLDVWN